jgi:hypothetical protein
MNREAEALVLGAIRDEWIAINRRSFDFRLRLPVFQLSRGETQLGSWTRGQRLLSLSLPFVASASWIDVIEVLKHEMAHQYVDEVLGVHDETAHGPRFVEVCARLGIDAAAAGRPDAGASDDHRLLKRIRLLLALAESPNRHEAEAAMKAAQRLMLKYNIELASLGRPVYRSRQLGPVKSRLDAAEKLLSGLLGQHFFVSPIIVPAWDVAKGRWARAIEVTGTPENLDIACWVYDWVLETASRLWDAHRRAHPEVAGVDRRTYTAGVVSGFGETLRVGRKEAAEAGLVWVGDAERDAHFARRHPRIVNHTLSVRHGSAFSDGKAAGRQIVLNKPVTGSADRGRQLSGPDRG